MTKREFDCECVALSDEGRGIIRYEGNTFFVDDLLVGEKGRVCSIFKNGKIFDTKLIKRYNDSEDRVKPKCKYYELCGGCQIMHLDYDAQLTFKQNKVKNLIHKFAHIDFEVSPTVAASESNRYYFRNKVQKPVGYDKKSNRVVLGFYKKNSHDLVPITSECMIESSDSIIISKEVTRLINDFKYSYYDEDKRKGLIRHVLIKTSSYYKEALVCLVVNASIKESNKVLPGRKNFVTELIRRCKSVTSVVINFNNRDTSVILGTDEIVIYGKGVIKDRILNNTFTISASSFYQTNPYMVETLYSTAINMLDLNDADIVLDAYSGTGTIGICMSKYCKHVTLCELNKNAYRDSITNAKINECDNITFINLDCTKYLTTTDDKFTVIVMDPPRKGSTKEFIEAMCSKKPRKICYISCDPVTLARDLTYFSADYKLKKVVPVDMFPHSSHVETVALLEREGE